MPDTLDFLKPVLALILWTCIMWFWMYATRLPAFSKAGIKPEEARHPGTYVDRMPASVRSVADNYNHLHEQPVIFYAVMFFAALTGGGDSLNMMLAWAYAGSRVVHSFVQIIIGTVPLRFLVFAIGSFILFTIAVREALRVFL
jgi:hypothetical protein